MIERNGVECIAGGTAKIGNVPVLLCCKQKVAPSKHSLNKSEEVALEWVHDSGKEWDYESFLKRVASVGKCGCFGLGGEPFVRGTSTVCETHHFFDSAENEFPGTDISF